ncbi:MAG: indole-3-glycerol phosphate synthase TrpC [Saprospiraceae bacterium]|nr:indole-3-glycerol phosphate synthase TrpC [Saprospiraceae bacterium]
MTFLEKIIQHKQQEVAERKRTHPVSVLEKMPHFNLPSISLSSHLCEHKGSVIAEFKRRSPSQGAINDKVSLKDVTRAYVDAGAIALSVLTDIRFFGGSNADLQEARCYNMCPILRKDFVVDEYQLLEAKAIGADVVLLIAECLSAKALADLSKRARALGLEVLLELHSASQLDKIPPDIDVLGINNRDLHSFRVDLDTSYQLIEAIPKTLCCISESGIQRPEEAIGLRNAGFKGFLMGTHFMSQPDPGVACAEFIHALKRAEPLPKIIENAG